MERRTPSSAVAVAQLSKCALVAPLRDEASGAPRSCAGRG